MSLRQYLQKVLDEDQRADKQISLKETPRSRATELDTPRVECAVVELPGEVLSAAEIASTIQREMVSHLIACPLSFPP